MSDAQACWDVAYNNGYWRKIKLVVSTSAEGKSMLVCETVRGHLRPIRPATIMDFLRRHPDLPMPISSYMYPEAVCTFRVIAKLSRLMILYF